MTLINRRRHFSPNMGYFTHLQENPHKQVPKIKEETGKWIDLEKPNGSAEGRVFSDRLEPNG
jgi:hypothetical protein